MDVLLENRMEAVWGEIVSDNDLLPVISAPPSSNFASVQEIIAVAGCVWSMMFAQVQLPCVLKSDRSLFSAPSAT